jgi:hypothetical protein
MATLKELGLAIAGHPNKVMQVFLGFDLWLEVQASGKVSMKLFKPGGVPSTDDDLPGILKIPLQIIGRDIVIAVDITLPPDGFRIAP